MSCKTAVIISGHMRTFGICYPNQKWMVYRHYGPDVHFFVCVHDNVEGRTKYKLYEDYENVHLEFLKEPADLPVVPVDASYGTPYSCSVPNIDVVSQLWANNQAWRFFKEKAGNEYFDVIIRMRPDIYFHRFIPPPVPKARECYAPWWGKFGGINDRFAVMGETAASRYFNEYTMLLDLLKDGCPFHPETILAQAMNDVTVRSTLMTEFSTVRLNGDVRKPEVVMADILELIQSCVK